MRYKKTFYIWKCSHCEHRNKEVFNFHWDFTMRYTITWYCSKCGNKSFIDLSFKAYPITEKYSESYYERWY